jgi:hypothetical protein
MGEFVVFFFFLWASREKAEQDDAGGRNLSKTRRCSGATLVSTRTTTMWSFFGDRDQRRILREEKRREGSKGLLARRVDGRQAGSITGEQGVKVVPTKRALVDV